ncbi:hypothetical protein VKT23_020083 [Stygiomarasmius scandens]|uniref:Uncharacterized protein n=1 Tax=Marasmiellus scandens TaxID=2682957 RepID=A0ABR1IMK4_9AGAR
MNKEEVKALLCAAARLAPDSSKTKKRLSYTVAFIEMLLKELKPDIPLDAAIADGPEGLVGAQGLPSRP